MWGVIKAIYFSMKHDLRIYLWFIITNFNFFCVCMWTSPMNEELNSRKFVNRLVLCQLLSGNFSVILNVCHCFQHFGWVSASFCNLYFVFSFYGKSDRINFWVDMKESWLLFVTREKAQYFDWLNCYFWFGRS